MLVTLSALAVVFQNVTTQNKIDKDSWTLAGSWSSISDMVTCQQTNGVAGLNGKLYAIAGDNGGALNLVTVYDTTNSTPRWQRLGVTTVVKRRDVAVGVLYGFIYAVGGTVDGSTPVSSVERYDGHSPWTLVAPMGTARMRHGVAELNGYLYAAGGMSSSGSHLASVEKYNPATNSWSGVKDMPYAVDLFGFAGLNGKLYAVGGNFVGNQVACYDPNTNAWKIVASMISSRAAHAVGVLDGKLYAVGGEDGDDLSSAEFYDDTSDTWHSIPNMATPRRRLGVGVVYDKLYAVGGYSDNGGSVGIYKSVEAYSPAALQSS